jgi:von Willebrand factor type A domain
MSSEDRRPLANAPSTNRIRPVANNRLGAIYSALFSFWSARHAATTARRQTIGMRRDAYSVILFNDQTTPVLTNDFMSSPGQLLDAVLRNEAYGGTNFSEALRTGRAVMEQNWNTERYVT